MKLYAIVVGDCIVMLILRALEGVRVLVNPGKA